MPTVRSADKQSNLIWIVFFGGLDVDKRLNALGLAVATALTAAQGSHAADLETQGVLQIAQASAQQPQIAGNTLGSIEGRVQDANRAFQLNGALITVEGSNREARTDRSGRFSLVGLPPDNYRLHIDYLGYRSQSVEVTVEPGGKAQLDIGMEDEAVAMGVMNVQAIRDIQSRSLNRQRAADNIMTVVSADSIGRFPDGNVAESLSRTSGVSVQRDQGEGRYINVRGAPAEFNRVAIDGIALPSPDGGTRAIDLDTIPTDIVASLEVTKALTPDLDADSIGGHVNITTRSAFDESGPFLRANVGYGYNELGSGDNHRLGLTLGNTFADDRIGLVVSASHSRTERQTDNVEHDWTEIDGEFFPEETVFKDYELTRERYALSGRLDFRVSERSTLYLSGTHSKFVDDEIRHATEFEYGGYAPGSTPDSGTFEDVEVTKELRHRRVENTLNQLAFGGEHRFDRFDVDYRVSTARAEQRYPKRDYLEYTLNYNPDIDYDWRNGNSPKLSVAGIDGLSFAPEDFEFSQYERRERSSKDREHTVASNVTVPFQLGTADAEAKFGLKVRRKEKSQDEDRFRNRSQPADGPEYSDVIRNERSNNFGYRLGNRFRKNTFDRYADIYRNDPNYRARAGYAYFGDFKAEEDIYALYGMNTFDWGATRLIVGARVEQTRTDAEAYYWDDDAETASLQEASRNYTHVFPSLHLRHEISRNLIVRGAYTTAINRPNLNQFSPYAEAEPADFEIERGNPKLDPTYAHNLDLMAEYYIRPLGIVSAGAFYKRLNDPIFEVTSNREIDGELWEVSQPDNGDSGYLYGVELNWQQGLSFLPEPLDGFGVFANYTYTESDADLPAGQGSVRLPGQSRHSGNLALYYERHGFNTRISYNYRSAFIDSVHDTNRALDTWWDSRAQIDLSASYQATDNFQLYAEAMNLTDSAQNRYRGDSNRVYEREKFGRFYQAGARLNF
ncbi:hypothetical protein CAI21_13815 [Alkalilimnicola ehrlichii]|nr:hypothetical protein CAI21_13815 [Alkalilimnicola ehrlichii]